MEMEKLVNKRNILIDDFLKEIKAFYNENLKGEK